MKLAVLGVGLIGGSIGKAARERLGAEVTGYDTDPELLARAVSAGAVDRAAATVEEAVDGAEVVFCTAPVAALPALVEAALGASGPETVVTDVGSVKRPLSGLGAEPRFIGGHPLAGAETAGVDHARADLFDGARWYLTPTEYTEGVLYDRLQRTIADLGGRPQAIDPDSHDRLMAVVSHVPHVVANVLASSATEALADGDEERPPEVGPSFRDATRVAGANPAIWGDILTGNREAVADGIDVVIERLRAASELLRGEDRDAVEAWHRAAGEARRELLESGLGGGELHELRVRVPNRPGIVAELALALGRAKVNIEDMGLYPVDDMSSGAVTLFIAGDEEARRAAELITELGHDVSEVAR